MSPSQDLLADWKSKIDEITTRLMIGTAGAELASELKQLASQMRENDAETLHDVLHGYIALLAENPELGTEQLLERGIADLQACLQSPSPAAPGTPASLVEDAELVADFVVESREHLAQIEEQILALERDPGCMDVIHAVFRAFHTIKGIAGFLEFRNLQELSHEVETLLDLARKEQMVITPAMVDIILESRDCLSHEVDAIERCVKGGYPLEPISVASLCARIRALYLAEPAANPQASTPHRDAASTASTRDTAQQVPNPQREPEPEDATAGTGSAAASLQQQLQPDPATAAEVSTTAISPPEVATLPAELPFTSTHPTTPPDSAAQPPAEEAGAWKKDTPRAKEGSSVRVDTAKLDHLMDMVGEMVIAQSLIRHNGVMKSISDSRFLADLSQLARATAEVQRATMSMRMIPVGTLFQRVERVVRDLSRKAGKKVTLTTQGTETGIDKTVAEELADPLLHMVRNSIDHGIEQPEERLQKGKPATATISLSAYHQGGQVIISISDDGRGLDPEKIRKKAEERDIVAASAQLTEAEIFQLIFEPGFSTAEKITDISGRGVGMDVVRRNVEKLRGRIEPESTLGQGTTFLLKLPLTLAIIDGLVVAVGSERFILPLSGVREMFRPAQEALFTVEGRDEMLMVRGDLVPLARLAQRLGIPGRALHPWEGLVVILESAHRRFGLVVDDLVGKQEVVIKGLGSDFRDIAELSGCAVLGDGRVGLILDIDGLYRGRR